MRQPVTLGSSVPLCPVLSTRRIRRNQATTSWEEGLDGLSRLITPDLGYRYGLISRGTQCSSVHSLDISLDVSFKRATSGGDWGEVTGTNKQLVVVFQQQRPLGSVQDRLLVFGLDGVVPADLSGRDLLPAQGVF